MTDFSPQAVDEATGKKRRKPAKRASQVAVQPPSRQMAPQQPTSMLQLLQTAVSSPEIDVAKMRELFELSRELEKDADRREFHARMARLQAEIAPIAADAANRQTSSRYASYAALDRALRPHYTRHGFSVAFTTEPSVKGELFVRVNCIVSYGAWQETSGCDIPINTKGAKGGDVMTITHATASAISYGKRYSLAMAFNLAIATDDDGNAASPRLVTDAQIVQLIEESKGHDTSALFEKMGIESWAQLPQSEFKRVMSFMAAKKQQKQEGK